jgi:magnesium-transporting ATPase (P-type)
MKRIKETIISAVAVFAFAVVPAPVVLAQGAVCSGPATECLLKGQQEAGGSENQTDLTEQIRTITNVLLFILGAIAVIMIIIGGIRYATSNGESAQIKSAKDTILYSVIGLVVAILAYALVNFIVSAFK